VREVFVTLYERDLLYKGNYLVNWCCSCGTALSDDEVDH
jgi:valyl-tRNA synthetase